MRLGYSTNDFASHRLRDALEVIAGFGFKSVAITLDAGALDPYDPSTAREARAIGAWLAEHDLVPVVETGARFLLDPWRKHWPTLLSPRREDRERRIDFLRRAIGIAALLSAEVVDRKSTRLNSSHLVISYAVFCLKKKKPTSAHRCRLLFFCRLTPRSTCPTAS